MMDTVKQSVYDSLRMMLPVPAWQKMLALLFTFVVIVAVYYSLAWVPLQDQIKQQEQQVNVQKIKLIKNQRLAHNLPRKQREYARLEKELKVALNMLPKKSQIPDLLESVSWAGKDSGLEFKTFRPEQEVNRQIYAEVPVSFNITGGFVQLLTFLKRVGEMPRIVDIKQMTLVMGKDGKMLSVDGKAVTYRFVDAQPKKTRSGRRK